MDRPVTKKIIMEQQNIQQAIDKLFSLLGITSSCMVTLAEDIIDVTIQGQEENGILIGYHGETLEALQLLIALILAKEAGTFHRVSIEIGEYKKNRMEYLTNLVNQTKEQVVVQKAEIPLPNLKSWERRFVHTLVAEDPDVVTESSGEGRDRTLIMYPKNNA